MKTTTMTIEIDVTSLVANGLYITYDEPNDAVLISGAGGAIVLRGENSKDLMRAAQIFQEAAVKLDIEDSRATQRMARDSNAGNS